MIAVGRAGRKAEDRARSLRVNDESLVGRYIDICEAWVNKPFPNF